MTKRRAKKLLKGSIIKMNYLWTSQEVNGLYLKMYIHVQHIFGKESDEFSLFKNVPPKENNPIKEYHQQYTKVINLLIEVIDEKGIPSKGNFLSRISEGWLIFWCGLLIPSLFFSGYYFGKRESIPLSSPNEIPKEKTTPNEQKVRNTIPNKIHVDSLKK